MRVVLHNKTKFELFFTDFCKSVLGVSKNTSSLGAKAEQGEFPISLTIMQKIVQYFARASQFSENTLCKKALLQQDVLYKCECTNNKQVKRSYLHSVYNIVKLSKCYKLTLNNKGLKLSKQCKKHLKISLQEVYSTLYFDSFQNKLNKTESKLRSYNLVKTNYGKEAYLSEIKSSNTRRSISKIRLSDHKLPIETGRRMGISCENRICNMCNLNKVGDEFHFITECKNEDIAKLRFKLYCNIVKIQPQFKYLCERNKFLYIFACHDLAILKYTGDFITEGLKMLDLT